MLRNDRVHAARSVRKAAGWQEPHWDTAQVSGRAAAAHNGTGAVHDGRARRPARPQVLSRAFRSRFLELHVGDIPDGELATILEGRCALAPSYAAKLVAVMRALQRRRQARALRASLPAAAVPRMLQGWQSHRVAGPVRQGNAAKLPTRKRGKGKKMVCAGGAGQQCVCRQARLHHAARPVQVGRARRGGLPGAG
jgi:hypothetical protein